MSEPVWNKFLSARVRGEMAKWAKVVKDAGLPVQ